MKNITLKQYTALKDTFIYDSMLMHLNPKNSFANRQMNVSQMPYANVKYCIRQLQKVNSWQGIQQLFVICYGITEKDFWKARVVEYFAARRFMIAEFERIIATENKLLATQNTNSHLWEMAGADRLKNYSDTLPLLQLGRLFGQYPFDLGRKPYSEIFNLLVQTKTQNEVEAEYAKLGRNG
ncbi:hypothetical protein GR160_08590 [Flavobacterium sp. Sd200]|uniref:hypothetical protein n=1 Tax=Flavobacterium sp. Sd200 TaxID=2692211 RepID=UPI00136E87F9|nr:hypothetical protein [Flavobacterium sp. Sd200]MXN91285.1 hypothetical protein [Flavobacterium sp. Sd200]